MQDFLAMVMGWDNDACGCVGGHMRAHSYTLSHWMAARYDQPGSRDRCPAMIDAWTLIRTLKKWHLFSDMLAGIPAAYRVSAWHCTC